MDDLATRANRQLHGWQDVAHQLGGIGRSKVFQLWASGELGSVKVGNLRFSTDRQIAVFIAKLEGAA
ncbi:MAG: hypothetical protein E6R06_26180 [Mycobacterium sp.]|nr:MAG: hypothetical protein E6R06_26180 [Mycobacterium sp.]